MDDCDYITPKELALLTGKSLRTVRRWIRDGTVVYLQPNGKGSSVLIPRRGYFASS